MSLFETIVNIAVKNAKRCHPKRSEDLDKTLPYFELSKNIFGRYDASFGGTSGHDNEPRMQFVLDFFKTNVFPNIDHNLDISGCYNLELHDSFSYLENDKDYTNVLSFGSIKDDHRGIMIPDAYFMGNWGNQQSSIKDPLPFSNKQSKIIWVGTSTGKRLPPQNERIQTCLWSLDRRHFCDFYVTKVAQIDPTLIPGIPRFNEIFRDPINIGEQMKYKYHWVMDGNASTWNVWEYFTNSLVMKKKSDNILWYSELFKDKEHFIGVDDMESLESTYKYYENNQNEATNIIKSANKLARDLFKPLVCQYYCVNLFESIAHNKS
jgi:hypothetical protein